MELTGPGERGLLTCPGSGKTTFCLRTESLYSAWEEQLLDRVVYKA
jgi:hypothetical protein